MSERFLKFIIVVLAVIAHFIAYWQFNTYPITETLSMELKNLVTGLLIISLLVVFLIPFCHNQLIIRYLLSFRAILILLTGQITGDYFGLELTLLVAVIMEAGVYTPFWHGIVYGCIITFLGTFLHIRVTSFGVIAPLLSWHERLGFILILLLIIGITAILRYERENQIPAVELNRRLQEATVELAQTNMKLQEYAITAEQEAMLNERKRVAREIHDTLAYTLTNLLMMMEAAIDLAMRSRPELINHLETARDQAKEGLTEVRHALQALRPVEYSGFSGLSAIQRLVRAFEKATQVNVTLELGDVPLYLSEEANLTLFRLVQEGMTNALRHGKASRINVLFTRDFDGVSVTISDNGIGSGKKEPKTGFGLIGMQERIQRLGGQMEVYSIPGEGFTLKASVPLREE